MKVNMTKVDLRILTLQEGILAQASKVFNINVKALFGFKRMRVILLVIQKRAQKRKATAQNIFSLGS